MKEAIQTAARELGFDACGFAPAAPPASGDRLLAWLDRGQQGDMAYLGRNAWKRLDPQRVLPGARTVVSLLTSYHAHRASAQPPATGGPTPPQNGPRGRIARYARYTDYHIVLGERLRALTDRLQQLAPTGTRSLWYVDTGPVLERDFAQLAGLGFIGKHTNLVSRRLGNWTFIAEILTTADIPPDPPEPNRCGSCTRCISACPTDAIRAPFDLDARRCISYLTIELKGPIPVEWRRAVGDRIFGCDDCLEACPWNRFAQDARLLAPHAKPGLDTPALATLLELDATAFKHEFAETPLARSKHRGLLRNVCVALGNTGTPAQLPALERAARSPEPLVAEHATWAIGEIQRRTRQFAADFDVA